MTSKTTKAKRSPPMDAMPTLGELGKWRLEHHTETLLLGDPQFNRGCYPAYLTLHVNQSGDGSVSGSCSLSTTDSNGKQTAVYGPGYIAGADLDALRTAAIEWAHAYVASIARDLGLIPRPFEKESTP